MAQLLLLPIELFDLIYELLEPIYKALFAMTCKALYCIRIDLCKIIHDRAGAIAQIAVECGGVINGAFVLDCLFGTNYTPDIDILFDVGLHPIELCAIHEDPKIKYYDEFWSKINPQGISITYCYQLFNNKQTAALCTINEYNFEGRRIKVIKCPRTGVIEYVTRFDYDFCKVIFDGKLRLLHPRTVICKESQELDSMQCTIEYGQQGLMATIIHTAELRRQKYRARGFKILD